MTPSTPERSLVQRMDALNRANQIRITRADFKRDLKAGRASLPDALLLPPDWLETARVFDLLLAVPKYGRVKTNKILNKVRISPSKTVAGLSARQRHDLVLLLRGYSAPKRPAPRTDPLPLPVPVPLAALTAALTSEPTTFERRVLALAVLDFGEVNQRNVYAAANALGSNPGAVLRACERLQEKRLLNLTGRPTDAGRAHASVLPTATPVPA